MSAYRVPASALLATLLACSSGSPVADSPQAPPDPAANAWDDRLSVEIEAGVADVVPRTLRAWARITNESG